MERCHFPLRGLSVFSPLNSRVFLALLFALATLFAQCAAGSETPAFTLQGFGTLGLTRTSSNDVAFVRDLSQPKGAGTDWSSKVDSVLGVQANWMIAPEWSAVVQAMSRYRYDGSFVPQLTWAYLRYDPTPAVSLRAGRLGMEFLMLADSRWVGYSVLPVRPPGDYFWYLPFYEILGGDATFSQSLGEGMLKSKVFYGSAQDKLPLAGTQWNVDGSPMLGGYLEYQHGPWVIRGSYANIRFSRDLPLAQMANVAGAQMLNAAGSPVAAAGSDMPVSPTDAFFPLSASDAAFLSTQHKRTHYYSLGLIYDEGPWLAQLMWNHVKQQNDAMESSNGGYVLLGHRFGAVTPFIGHSRVHSSPGAQSPSLLVATMVADSHSDQQTNFVGGRWDVARNVALKAQWDAIRSGPGSIYPYRQETDRWSGKLDVFSLTLDFIF